MDRFTAESGFSMDPWWYFTKETTEDLQMAIANVSGGLWGLWDRGTAGKNEYGFLLGKLAANGKTLLNPTALQACHKLMHCML